MPPISTNRPLPSVALRARRRRVEWFVASSLLLAIAGTLSGAEQSNFLTPPTNGEPLIEDEANVADESFAVPPAEEETDVPFAICDGENAVVYESGFHRGPGMFRRLDMGWRPGMFLSRSDLDWREWVWLPQFGYRDPDDPLRHRGWGEPMVGTSWRNRPFAVDWAFGGTGTAGLTENARQTGGTVGGYRLAYDFDHYWGIEWRHLWASANLRSTVDLDYSATTQHQFYDVSLIWYPWGDARWRPYAGLGLGMASYDFFDGAGLKVDETMLTMPIAGGIKYYVAPWAILRLDLSETIVFPGSDIDTHVQFMATVGTEFRFGGKRTKYYPWETGWKP